MITEFIDIETLKKLLENNSDNPFSEELNKQITFSTVRIHQTVNLPTDHALNVYTLRHKILVESDNPSTKGLDNVVRNLGKLKSPEVKLFFISTSESLYIVFCSSDYNQLIGIVKNSKYSIKKEDERNEEYKELGYKIRTITFNKGVRE